MFTEESDTDGVIFRLEAAIDLASANQAREALLGAVATASGPVRLDLSSIAATAPAIQLVLSARESLVLAHRFAGFGPTAANLLATVPVACTALSVDPERSAR